jgi:hypothetical protein
MSETFVLAARKALVTGGTNWWSPASRSKPR